MPAFMLSLLSSRQTWGALGLALLVAAAGVQTARLAHAKSDLATARAAAIDPATRRSWQTEAEAAMAALTSCEAGVAQQNAALDVQRRQDDAATAAAQSAVARAQNLAKAASAHAAAVLAASPVAVAGCSDADALILKSLDP